MAQFSGKTFRPRQERGVRQGQETVEKNRDIRVDLTANNKDVELTNIYYIDAARSVKPRFESITFVEVEGFRKFVELCNDIIDAWDGVEGAPRIPIDRSEYARRGWPLDGE